MKVYLTPPSHLSKGIHRVADALKLYAPADIQVVDTLPEADLRVIHTIGWAGMGEAMAACPDYAIFQYCVASTEDGNLRHWAQDVWQEAKLVASYYPLQEELHQVGLKGLADLCRFYLTPLGVDTAIFKPRPIPTHAGYLVGTSGYVAETECIREWAEVCYQQQAQQFHLGPSFGWGDAVYRVPGWSGLTDTALAMEWSDCQFVSGLRRTEGFELPAAEGLCCGARPVLFDRPHHRRWFEDRAIYIQETDYADVVRQLREVVTDPYPIVMSEEIAWAAERFSWERMAAGFWQRLVEEV